MSHTFATSLQYTTRRTANSPRMTIVLKRSKRLCSPPRRKCLHQLSECLPLPRTFFQRSCSSALCSVASISSDRQWYYNKNRHREAPSNNRRSYSVLVCPSVLHNCTTSCCMLSPHDTKDVSKTLNSIRSKISASKAHRKVSSTKFLLFNSDSFCTPPCGASRQQRQHDQFLMDEET